jgi:HAD superfamily phosphatase
MPTSKPTNQSTSTQPIRAIIAFDIDGVLRDVSGSYRRALADTVEQFTQGAYRPTAADIDQLKAEGIWNNDWEASQELIYRHFEQQGQPRSQLALDYDQLVQFFQSRYRGPDPNHWTGYICDEPLLTDAAYFEALTQHHIGWGFFSGATRGSATYVLRQRLELTVPVLIAMEDAPGKPDPTGLVATVHQLEQLHGIPSRSTAGNAVGDSPSRADHSNHSDNDAAVPVIYIGDTVADMQTVNNVRQSHPDRTWIGVGVLPPHTQVSPDYAAAYGQRLEQAGAIAVLQNVRELTAELALSLVQQSQTRVTS